MSGALSLPEFTVRDAIEETIGVMLADDALILNDMLAERPQAERESFAGALANREGRVRLGWALEHVEDWMVNVLKVRDIPHQTLGQQASRPQDIARASRTLAAPIGTAEGIAVTFAAGTPAVGEDVGEVDARGLLRMGAEVATYVIASGVCTLVARGVRGTPVAAHASGADVLFVETSQRVGWPSTEILRADVLGSNPPFVMALARMLQAFLVRSAAAFDDRGYTLMEVTSGDMEARPAYYPAHLFLRSLTIKVETEMSLPESYPVIAATAVTLTAEA